MELEIGKSQTLYSLVVELAAAEDGFIPATLSRAIHGLVMNWLRSDSAEIAADIHASQCSPFSLSMLEGNRRPNGTHAGDRFYFRICLLDGNLIQVLLDGIVKSEQQPIVLAKIPFLLRHVYTLPGTHNLAGSANYELLAQTPASTSDITLNFKTPTSFKQNSGIQNFPLPELVFSNLQRRWNYFAPENLQLPAVAWLGLVSAYELKTYAMKMEGGAEIGAQGWAKYRFFDAEQLRQATILAHFAFFAGVGRKTTMGMGQTKLQVSPPQKKPAIAL